MDKNLGITCYQVGKRFDRVLKQDGAIFELLENKFIINIGLTNLSSVELQALEGPMDTYLSVVEGIVFVTMQFGDVLTFDMPFNAGLYKEFTLKDPIPYGFMVPVISVENRTNIVVAIRLIGFDSEFSKQLYKFARRQWENKIPDYDERLKSVYDRFSVEDIIRLAIRKNIIGGTGHEEKKSDTE